MAMITSLVLGQVNLSRQRYEQSLRRQEVLNLAIMAVQTKQDRLSLNGQNVAVVRNGEGVMVYDGEQLILSVEKN